MSRQLKKRGALTGKRPIADGAYKKALLMLQRNEGVQVVLAILVMLGSLYFIQIKYQEHKIAQILKDPAFAVGTIMQVGSRHVTVEFKDAGNTYLFKRREPEELLQGRVAGDTAGVIYERSDPDNAALKKGFSRFLDD
jgi:hypothetical protein